MAETWTRRRAPVNCRRWGARVAGRSAAGFQQCAQELFVALGQRGDEAHQDGSSVCAFVQHLAHAQSRKGVGVGGCGPRERMATSLPRSRPHGVEPGQRGHHGGADETAAEGGPGPGCRCRPAEWIPGRQGLGLQFAWSASAPVLTIRHVPLLPSRLPGFAGLWRVHCRSVVLPLDFFYSVVDSSSDPVRRSGRTRTSGGMSHGCFSGQGRQRVTEQGGAGPECGAGGTGLGRRSTTGAAFDLDASALLLAESGKVVSDGHFVFYNNLTSPDGSVEHTGDNLTGEGEGDDEAIKVNLAGCRPRYQDRFRGLDRRRRGTRAELRAGAERLHPGRQPGRRRRDRALRPVRGRLHRNGDGFRKLGTAMARTGTSVRSARGTPPGWPASRPTSGSTSTPRAPAVTTAGYRLRPPLTGGDGPHPAMHPGARRASCGWGSRRGHGSCSCSVCRATAGATCANSLRALPRSASAASGQRRPDSGRTRDDGRPSPARSDRTSAGHADRGNRTPLPSTRHKEKRRTCRSTWPRVSRSA